MLLWWLATLVALQTSGTQGATSQDVATLKVLASELGIPPGLWNFSVDPCSGRWPGVGCCTNTSSKPCCVSPAQVYTTPRLSLDCEASANASVSALLLRSELTNVTLNGTLSSSICNLSLLLLDIGFNSVGGAIPACLGSQKKLQVLRLGANRINGSIPQELGSLLNLQELYLDDLNLSGQIPSSLGNLSNLTSLFLRSNRLEGFIPTELGQLTSLVMLHLQVNRLSGNIPSSMSKLVSLNDLILARNSLTGQMNGSTFNAMQQLKILNLSSNSLSGAIPELAIPQLKLLDLRFNMFDGSMPTFRESPAIKQLFLGHNNLQGGIPSGFSAARMDQLDLSHNQLSGPVDSVLDLGSASGSGLPQSNVAFNFFENASRVLILNQSSNLASVSVFNCVPGPSCRRSSPGNAQSFAVNAGGGQRSVLGFAADDLGLSTLGLFYGSSFNWAIELSGTLGGFEDSTKIIKQAENNEQALYQSMRWSSSYIAYHGVGLASGKYNVTLYFAEIIFDQPGYRQFDVLLNGRMWKQGLDVVKEAGAPDTAYRISKITSVDNGTLAVELRSAGKDMYVLAGKFKEESRGPMISAISVTNTNIRSGKKSKSRLIVPAVVGSLGTLLVVLTFGGCYLWSRRRRMRPQQAQEIRTPCASDLEVSKVFTYEELCEATGGFTEKLGEGGFGVVYKGKLSNGATIAVKQLVEHDKKQDFDFRREISILSNVRHKNLLSVLGCCLDSDNAMLVTEFVPNGSLDKWLLKQRPGGEALHPLSWEARRSVAIGVACGLAYLHEESKDRIIHCDVKPANILLDSDMNPRLADFGLAKLYNEKASHITATRLQGTAGYLAPEYAMHLQVSDKVDVYSFGVLLLELLSGRRAVDLSVSSRQCVLVDWVHKETDIPAHLVDIIDKNLESNYSQEQARDMATVAILCTQRKPAARPKMQDVWLMLNGTVKVPEFLASLDAAIQHSI